MKHSRKQYATALLRQAIGALVIASFVLQPSVVIAQTAGQFNPNASLQSNGRSFSGVTFSGVGGAIAGCTNIGNTISGGISSISSIFRSSSSAGSSSNANSTSADESLGIHSSGISSAGSALGAAGAAAGASAVPVVAQKTDEELKKANQRESCLNGVAYAVAKSLLQQVTNKTLAFVNTGLDGNALYVRNIDSYLRTISNEQVSLFLNQLPSRDPIFGTAIRSIVTQELSGIDDGLIGTVMDTPEARAYRDFQDDFTNGGWQAFLNPRYNAVDAIFEAGEQLGRQVGTAQQNVTDAVQRNGGFLDLTRCVEYAPESNSMNNPALQSAVDSTEHRPCLRYETVTPGTLIAAQASEILTSPVRQLEQADQINEVLGAFFDQLLNRLLSDGLASLRGRSENGFSFNGIGSNVVLGTNGAVLSSAQTGAGALGYQQSGTGFVEDFDVSRPQHIRAVLQTQYDYLNRLRDARAALNRIVPTIGALDYCIPGPNPGWAASFEDNSASFFGSFQEVPRQNGNAGSTIGSAAGAIGGSFIPGIGTAIGGAIGGLIGGLFGSNESHTIVSQGAPFYDRVTTQTLTRSYPLVFRERNRSTQTIFENVQRRWTELSNAYKDQFTLEKISNAFASADAANAAFARGFTATAYEETRLLPEYAAAAIEIDAYYESAEESTVEAIRRLNAIRAEADAIVTTAKTRYIAEQAAAGTPVRRSCIDEAYKIDASAITPVTRQESNTPSPFFDRFIEANNYFYSTL